MADNKITKFKKKLLSAKKIGLDTMCFIYQFADHKDYAPLTSIIFELLETGKIKAVTSTISVLEIFVQPEAQKETWAISEYEKVLQQTPNLEPET